MFNWPEIKSKARLAAWHSLYLVIAAAAYNVIMEKQLIGTDMANDFLKSKISELDETIHEIKELEERKLSLATRLDLRVNVVNNNRAAVELLNLVVQSPDGISIEQLAFTPTMLTLDAWATDPASGFSFLESLHRADWMFDRGSPAFTLEGFDDSDLHLDLTLHRNLSDDSMEEATK